MTPAIGDSDNQGGLQLSVGLPSGPRTLGRKRVSEAAQPSLEVLAGPICSQASVGFAAALAAAVLRRASITDKVSPEPYA